MPTNWSVPTVAQVESVLDKSIVEKLRDSNRPDTGNSKLDTLLSMVVLRVRAAVLSGSRNNVSATVGSVPPDGLHYTILLTARALINTMPTAVSALSINDDFVKQCDKAEAWLTDLRKGLRCTPPIDPANEISGPDWGSDALVDLSTDGV